jgi:putative transposase
MSKSRHTEAQTIGALKRMEAGRVTRVLERAIDTYGKPQAIRCDNGPELTSRHFLAWAIENTVDVMHIRVFYTKG